MNPICQCGVEITEGNCSESDWTMCSVCERESMVGERGGGRRRNPRTKPMPVTTVAHDTVTITKPTPLERLMDWTFSQGPSTVVLVMILFGGGYMAYQLVPRYIQQLGETQMAIEKSHREEREKAMATSADQREKDRAMRDKEREMMERMLDNLVPRKPE